MKSIEMKKRRRKTESWLVGLMFLLSASIGVSNMTITYFWFIFPLSITVLCVAMHLQYFSDLEKIDEQFHSSRYWY